MYDDLKFAPAIVPLHTSDIIEATSFTESLHVTPVNVTIKDISVEDDSTMKYNGEYHNITQYGFEKFCQFLKIPRNFARSIPIDLLFKNIRRLSASRPDDAIVVLVRDNGDIAGVANYPYKEPSYSDIFSVFADKEGFKYANISEELITLCFMDDKVVLAKDDDPLNVGTFVYSSILQDCKVHAFSGLYRHVCENSFVMPFFGKVKANYKNKDTMLLRFADSIKCFDEQIYNRLNTEFRLFPERRLFDTEIASLWKSLTRTVNSSEADILLKLDEESRKNLLTTVQIRFSENKKKRLEGRSVDENVLTSTVAYNVLNDITSYSRNHLFGDDKKKVEKLAGDWVEKLILN